MKKIEKVLNNKEDNYIFPFFWLRGEAEAALREYMEKIDAINIKAVCVESRPHPDYCGPQWWHDMDIIIEEAKKRDMKIWILDDSHFPTGYAAGAMKEQPDEYCRQSICCRVDKLEGNAVYQVDKEKIRHPDPFEPNMFESMTGYQPQRVFDDDRLFGIFAVNQQNKEQEAVDLSSFIENEELYWEAPEGKWKVYTLHLSRNMGYHRDYINMMNPASCKVLIDAVYESHYEHYKEEFGKTIAGFFSDEPELGNGHMYNASVTMGSVNDFPWSQELESALEERLGEEYKKELYLLWENDSHSDAKARIRYTYMDAVTALVRDSFSVQIGEWCRKHGVEYIGHLIEDNNQHTQTGSSLGHYFRGLFGQDMAGIDDIGGQVLPQGEDVNVSGQLFGNRNGEFYHYMLGKLANSAAAIEPLKKGNAMCEIFGAYGWKEGVRLEKYLLDHFLVRGINHYVPHAFSAAEYPDPDCPPHFYAHGHNPQFRHFGALMKYTNRICELISDGRHVAPAAILYHGESEWTGKYMESHKPAHILADMQIDYDFVPQDVFIDSEAYGVRIADQTLQINTQQYKMFLIPESQYITKALAQGIEKMLQAGVKVYVIGDYPEGICDGDDALLQVVQGAEKTTLEELAGVLVKEDVAEISLEPQSNRMRCYHYEHSDGTGVLFLVNEGTKSYRGQLQFSDKRNRYLYDGWNNEVVQPDMEGDCFEIQVEPLKSRAVLLTPLEIQANYVTKNKIIQADELSEVHFEQPWERSICRSIDYPNFIKVKQVQIPDDLAEEEPKFSGFAKYTNTFMGEADKQYRLEVLDAHEGVEVFLNGLSLGIQIAPPFYYDLSRAVKVGRNELSIEIATTLERENSDAPNPYGQKEEATALSGITGQVSLLTEDKK